MYHLVHPRFYQLIPNAFPNELGHLNAPLQANLQILSLNYSSTCFFSLMEFITICNLHTLVRLYKLDTQKRCTMSTYIDILDLKQQLVCCFQLFFQHLQVQKVVCSCIVEA